jgi:purine nucleosidase
MISTTDRPPYPVIIDTDPGLDDALAIFLACASQELEVILVTTVAGNVGVDLTTTNALGLLELLARHDIPVIAGAAKPLNRASIEAAHIHGADGMGGIVLPTPRRGLAGSDAAARIADELARRPVGSVRILALGPLTNLANLCLQYPSRRDDHRHGRRCARARQCDAIRGVQHRRRS